MSWAGQLLLHDWLQQSTSQERIAWEPRGHGELHHRERTGAPIAPAELFAVELAGWPGIRVIEVGEVDHLMEVDQAYAAVVSYTVVRQGRLEVATVGAVLSDAAASIYLAFARPPGLAATVRALLREDLRGRARASDGAWIDHPWP
jgi:hypothetical protein